MIKKLTLGTAIAAIFIAVTSVGAASTLPINPIFALIFLVIALVTHGFVLVWEEHLKTKVTSDDERFEDLTKRIRALEQSKNMEKLGR